ncbi:MAG: hypothetical protein C0507_12930 [Cyanobacteria bacterium PR.3.49]|nr:hypothetical protein [Cyanobacteria bacterium PR.3.49]
MVDTARDLASDAAYEVVTSRPDDAANAREELNSIWAAGNLRPDEIGSSLKDNNLLPGLVLHDSENLDPDGDGKLPYWELLGVANSEDADTLTKNLATYLAEQAYMRPSAEFTLDEFRDARGLPVDPIPGAMSFDPDTFSDGETRTSELSYAHKNFATLDADSDGYVTRAEIDETLSGGVSASDAAKLQDLRARMGDLEELSDDEFGDENDGFTHEDLRLAAQAEAVSLTGERAERRAEEGDDGPSDAPVTVEEVLSGDADKSDEPSEYLRDLQDKDSTVEEQLTAVKALVAAGQTTATIEDADGNPLTVRMDVQPVSEGSDRSYVHLYAVDESGRETVILRAITDGDGFAQQRDGNGNPVSYVGRKWSQNYPDSIFAE